MGIYLMGRWRQENGGRGRSGSRAVYNRAYLEACEEDRTVMLKLTKPFAAASRLFCRFRRAK